MDNSPNSDVYTSPRRRGSQHLPRWVATHLGMKWCQAGSMWIVKWLKHLLLCSRWISNCVPSCHWAKTSVCHHVTGPKQVCAIMSLDQNKCVIMSLGWNKCVSSCHWAKTSVCHHVTGPQVYDHVSGQKQMCAIMSLGQNKCVIMSLDKNKCVSSCHWAKTSVCHHVTGLEQGVLIGSPAFLLMVTEWDETTQCWQIWSHSTICPPTATHNTTPKVVNQWTRTHVKPDPSAASLQLWRVKLHNRFWHLNLGQHLFTSPTVLCRILQVLKGKGFFFINRLDTPPDHVYNRRGSDLRGLRYEKIPPVRATHPR